MIQLIIQSVERGTGSLLHSALVWRPLQLVVATAREQAMVPRQMQMLHSLGFRQDGFLTKRELPSTTTGQCIAPEFDAVDLQIELAGFRCRHRGNRRTRSQH